MSKFNVHGSAKQEFPAEQFKLFLTVRGTDMHAGESIRKGGNSIEQLLQALSHAADIQPEDIRLDNESASRSYGNDADYSREIAVSLVMPADLAALHRITAMLEAQGNAEYRIEYLLNDRKAAEEAVMRAAFADSRKKAELLADMLGQNITNAEKVNFEYDDTPPSQRRFKECLCAGFNDCLADRLQKPVVTIEKSVDITWTAE